MDIQGHPGVKGQDPHEPLRQVLHRQRLWFPVRMGFAIRVPLLVGYSVLHPALWIPDTMGDRIHDNHRGRLDVLCEYTIHVP